MAESKFLVDLSLVDFDRPVATLDEIRKVNPQRFEMEQLTAIVYENAERGACVGYKDVTRDEFWVRGHFPEAALIVRALRERLAMASLANGHRLLVRPVSRAVAVPGVGDRVLLEVSPFDLSKGVILKVLN